jgi:hypothetical protein
MHVQFAVDILDVGSGGAHADDQLARNLGALQPGRQQAQHLQLALRERLDESVRAFQRRASNNLSLALRFWKRTQQLLDVDDERIALRSTLCALR